MFWRGPAYEAAILRRSAHRYRFAHVLSVNGHSLCIECGLFQGRRSESYEKNLNFAFDPKKIGCLILSHAHIDHSGNIPNLVKKGFSGPIYATPPTADLCRIMLAIRHIYK